MRRAEALGCVLAAGLAGPALAQPAQFLNVGDAVFVAHADSGLPFRYYALDVPGQNVGPYLGVTAQVMGGLAAQTLLDPMPPGSATIRHLIPTAGNAEYHIAGVKLLAVGSSSVVASDFIPFFQEPQGGYDVADFPGAPAAFPRFAWTEGFRGAVGFFDGDGFGEIGDSPLLSAPRGIDRVRGPFQGKLGVSNFTVVVVDTRREAVVLVDLLTQQISDLSVGGLLHEPTAVAVGPYGAYVACPSSGPGQPARIVEVNEFGQQTLIYSGAPFEFPTDMAYYDGGYAVGAPLRLLVSDRLGPPGSAGAIVMLDLGAKTATADVISTGAADGYRDPEAVSTVPPGSDCPGSDCPGSDCPGDTTGDGKMDINDFFQFLSYYQAGDDRADLTLDGNINTNDFFQFLDDYKPGSDCP